MFSSWWSPRRVVVVVAAVVVIATAATFEDAVVVAVQERRRRHEIAHTHTHAVIHARTTIGSSSSIDRSRRSLVPVNAFHNTAAAGRSFDDACHHLGLR